MAYARKPTSLSWFGRQGHFICVPDSYAMLPDRLGRVALALAMHANHAGECSLSIARIGALTGIQRNHVSETLRKLEAVGVLTTQQRRGATSSYRLQDFQEGRARQHSALVRLAAFEPSALFRVGVIPETGVTGIAAMGATGYPQGGDTNRISRDSLENKQTQPVLTEPALDLDNSEISLNSATTPRELTPSYGRRDLESALKTLGGRFALEAPRLAKSLSDLPFDRVVAAAEAARSQGVDRVNNLGAYVRTLANVGVALPPGLSEAIGLKMTESAATLHARSKATRYSSYERARAADIERRIASLDAAERSALDRLTSTKLRHLSPAEQASCFREMRRRLYVAQNGGGGGFHDGLRRLAGRAD